MGFKKSSILKTSSIKSLWPVLISILGDENSIYTYSQSDLYDCWAVFEDYPLQNRGFVTSATQTASVTCVQVTFSNGEKSAERGQNACSFSVPCDRNISAALQGAELLRPPQKTSTAQGKYTKAQEVSTCITPSFQPLHSGWEATQNTATVEQQEANNPGKFSLGINATITTLLEHASYSRP